MVGDFDFNGFAETVREELFEPMRQAKTSAEVAAIMGRIHARVEDELARGLDPEEARYIACAPGCGSCCVVNVAVLFPEAVAIVHHLQRSLSDTARLEQRRKIEDLYRQVLWLDDEERLSLRRPCAFLDERQACFIYPVRPLLCRSITSTDAEACRQALASPDLAKAPLVLMNLFQKKLFESAFCALGAALEDLGFDARSAKLTVAVRQLLARPQLVEEYLAGGPVPVA